VGVPGASRDESREKKDHQQCTDVEPVTILVTMETIEKSQGFETRTWSFSWQWLRY
jgi:hypothetical protein